MRGTICALNLELDRKQLWYAIARGQGRAVLFLREYGGDEYLDLIVKACTTLPLWDTQTVGAGDYHWRLAQTLSNPDVLVPLIAKACRKAPHNRYNFRARLGGFVAGGNVAAKQAMWDLVKHTKDEYFRWEASDYFGFEGIEWLIRTQSHNLSDNDAGWKFYWLCDDFGRKPVEQLVRKMARRSSRAQRFLDLGLKRFAAEPKPVKTKDSAKSFAEAVELGRPYDASTKSASEEQWKELAERFLVAKEEKELRKLWKFLRRHGWPLDVQAALDAALTEKDDRIRFYRFGVLKATVHPLLREWALLNLTSKASDAAWDFMRVNARREDWRAAEPAVEALKFRPYEFHSSELGILHIVDEDQIPISTSLFHKLWEYSACPLCRNTTFRHLKKREPSVIAKFLRR